ncbi:MAG: copper homeostasis protein CutC [Bacteroidetes bacterium]|nr:MAG: copper homeostasis protein CutC [Bacteroidota bacterium]
MIFEICASTPIDVAVAKEVGANRVELCSHWECGGLTPSPASIRASVNIGIPIRALVRPRAGDFCYNASEQQLILAEALDCLDAGAEMVVLGGLNEGGEIDEALMEIICSKIPSDLIVFHRALDLSLDPMESMSVLQNFGIYSVLSSGAAPAAGLGLGLIKQLSDAGMKVIAGGGVRPEDVCSLGESGVEAIHASCRLKSTSELKVQGGEELFDLSTFPVDIEKAMVLSEAIENWIEFEDDE